MPKFRSHLDSPSNRALQFYLDDLSMPESHLAVQNIAILSEPTTANDVKLNNAKKLIEKSNVLNDLMPSNTDVCTEQEALESIDGLLQNPDQLNNSGKNDSSAKSKENSDSADNHTKSAIRNEQVSLYDSLPARFQVLLCDIGEQTLAIPLIELGGIMQVERYTQRSSKPSWYYGLHVKDEQTFTCIDSTYYLSSVDGVANAKRRVKSRTASSTDKYEYNYLVQLGKSEFALCCCKIFSTLEVEKQDVKWRQDITKKPWFAGILKEQLHALIDGAEVVRDILKLGEAT